MRYNFKMVVEVRLRKGSLLGNGKVVAQSGSASVYLRMSVCSRDVGGA